MTIVILLALLFAGLATGIEIIFALGIASLGALLFAGNIPLEAIPHRIIGGTDSFSLLSIPLFLMMGSLMEAGGITDRLLRFFDTIVGRFRGGLALANVGISIFFAGISGSSTADATSIGSILIPAMKKEKYDGTFSAAVTAAGASLGPIIPPSVIMIIYGIMTGVSILRLFLSGVVPGLVCGIGFLLVVYRYSVKRGYPKHPKVPLREIAGAGRKAIAVLVLPFIILVGVVGGMFTITESAGIAALYALALTLWYGELSGPKLWRSTVLSARGTAVVIFLVAVSNLFAWVFTMAQGPTVVLTFIRGLSENNSLIILFMNLYLLLIGMFIAPFAALVISVPFLVPLGTSIGMDPLQLGLMTVFNLNLGSLTPPVAVVLNLTAKMAGVSTAAAFKDTWPFFLIMVGVLILIAYWPPFTTFFPDWVLGVGVQ